jgi:hypothetical protein
MECAFKGLDEICTWTVFHPATQRLHSLFVLVPTSHTDTCILPSAPSALSLSSSHCQWRCFGGDGNVRMVGELKADWIPSICVHCRPGQSETQSHETIYISLSTTCAKALKKMHKSVHVSGAIVSKHRYSYFAPYVNITKYSSWTVKNK